MPAPPANVADWILSGGRSDAPAIWHGQQMLTHGELRRRARAIAAQLLSAGLAGGDRVGLFAENSPFFVAAYLGTIGAGYGHAQRDVNYAPHVRAEVPILAVPVRHRH